MNRLRCVSPVVLAALVLALGCEDDAAPSAAAIPSTEPPAAEPLAPWPAPEIVRRADRASATHVIEVTLSPDIEGSSVDVRAARGPEAPTCDEGRVVALESGAVHVEPGESVAICVRDADRRVRARATSEGHRSSPWAVAAWAEGRAYVRQRLGPLDDDVTAIVYGVGDRPPRLECRVEAASGPNDDPPEHCAYDCSALRIVGELPRAVLDALDEASSGDSADAYERSLSLLMPVVVAPGDRLVTCVRTSDGAVVTDDDRGHEISSLRWSGCDVDTVSGCVGDGDLDRPLRSGDVVIGRTEDGRAVRAHVRRATVRRQRVRTVDTDDGGTLVVPDDAFVLTDRGDVRADTIDVGTVLARRTGLARVIAVSPPDRAWAPPRARVDLEDAPYLLSNGFAIRDASGPNAQTSTEPAPERVPWVLAGESDCSLEVAWPASASAADVALSAQPISGSLLSTVAPRCDAPILTVSARAIAAVASLGEGARIVAHLRGAAITCDGSYAVTRCADGAPLDADALPGVASPACLPTGTPIATPDGDVAIEQLAPGDVIESFDPARGRRTRAQVLGVVTHAARDLLAITLDDGRTLEATPEHLLLAGDALRPTPASELARGEHLWVVAPDGALHAREVVAITPSRRAEVHDLRVSAPDTYFARGVLVHNY